MIISADADVKLISSPIYNCQFSSNLAARRNSCRQLLTVSQVVAVSDTFDRRVACFDIIWNQQR